MEKFTVTAGGIAYEILSVEEGDSMSYETTIKVVFRPHEGHLKAQVVDTEEIAHAIEKHFL